ncbi:ATPase inhibitor mai-2, mitochondrial [Elysia marginata]|uniref:ATPase inhibitor mai-2, mitochondrial n=1 Tax=Elysia marginata TaxID=1093978 RepID=A0AAV4HM18_9GAST|nr:ATPase inhibitor mai-2, mitochondrial [Elysia marginata]
MATRLPAILRSSTLRLLGVRSMSTGDIGDGAGKKDIGTFVNLNVEKKIRNIQWNPDKVNTSGLKICVDFIFKSAGGAFGKMEAAHEEQYFRKLQQEQLEKLKEMVEDEVAHHEQQIRIHQEAIEHHKRKMSRIDKQKDKDSDSD